jgi:hypothetical protein
MITSGSAGGTADSARSMFDPRYTLPRSILPEGSWVMESAENSWAAAVTAASIRIRIAAKHVLCVLITVTRTFDAVCRSHGGPCRAKQSQAANRSTMLPMTMAKVIMLVLSFLIPGLLAAVSQAAQQTTPPVSSTVTEISADLGPCKAAFHVTDLAGNPLYNAKIKTTIRYGFLSKRRLDLEAATNADGRARFVKLPAQVKQPLQFDVAYQDQTASLGIDPATDCEAERSVPLGVGKAEKAK